MGAENALQLSDGVSNHCTCVITGNRIEARVSAQGAIKVIIYAVLSL